MDIYQVKFPKHIIKQFLHLLNWTLIIDLKSCHKILKILGEFLIVLQCIDSRELFNQTNLFLIHESINIFLVIIVNPIHD